MFGFGSMALYCQVTLGMFDANEALLPVLAPVAPRLLLHNEQSFFAAVHHDSMGAISPQTGDKKRRL
jgi:hypothetical protein